MDTAQPSRLSAQCSICGAILSGATSIVFRSVGIRRSPRNPNLCTRCGTHVDEGRLVEITVLFADLSSFTEMTHELGPERTHEVVDAFLRMASEVLVSHGAFIDKYVGDAVMALFNVPVKYGDHARRAVFAATELASELPSLGRRCGIPLAASIGIATGWARVGRLGSEDSKDVTAIGDVVNLAARLQGKANAGEILISDATYVRHSTEFLNAIPEQVVLKGFREPVKVYRLMGKGDVRPRADDPPETAIKKQTSLGAIVFGILGAPCAVATLIGPLAVAFGAGGLFGLAAALSFLDQSAIRIPILVITAGIAVANLYTVWHARKLRKEENIPAHLKVPTTLEKRRTLFVLVASSVTMGIVVFEIVAHILLH
jgi:adenylate cyclase